VSDGSCRNLKATRLEAAGSLKRISGISLAQAVPTAYARRFSPTRYDSRSLRTCPVA